MKTKTLLKCGKCGKSTCILYLYGLDEGKGVDGFDAYCITCGSL